MFVCNARFKSIRIIYHYLLFHRIAIVTYFISSIGQAFVLSGYLSPFLHIYLYDINCNIATLFISLSKWVSEIQSGYQNLLLPLLFSIILLKHCDNTGFIYKSGDT